MPLRRDFFYITAEVAGFPACGGGIIFLFAGASGGSVLQLSCEMREKSNFTAEKI